MRNNILLFCYLLSCILFIGCLYHFPLTGIDDANIYFVYMKNSANGNGFVYTVGGERVEGFTSILWVILGSLLFTFTNHIEIYLLIINFLLIFLTLKISIKIIQLFLNHDLVYFNYTVFFLGMLIIFPGFYDWTIFSLLETGLWTFELIGFTYLLIIPYLKDDFSFQKSSLLMMLLFPFFIISRPESILLGMVFITIRIIQLLVEKYALKNIAIQIIPISVVYSLSLFLLTKWRLHYFGFPFPNTYYIKMTDGFINNLKDGAIYLAKYIIRTNPLIIVLVILIFMWCFKFVKQYVLTTKNKIISILIVLTVVGLCIPFYTGGDHFRLSRFYQVFCPIFYLCFLFILYSFSNNNRFISKVISSKKNIFLTLFILSIFPLKNLYLLFYDNKDTISIEFNIAKNNREIGNKLNAFFSNVNKPSIGVVAAGAIAYAYDGNINDVLGLNNKEVAHTIGDRPTNILKSHRAFNIVIFLRQRPELFLTEFLIDTSTYIPYAKRKNIDNEFGSKVIKHIYKDQNFCHLYSPIYIYNKANKKILFSYASNSYINSIDTSFYKIYRTR